MCFRSLDLKRAALAMAMLPTLLATPAGAGDLDDFNTATEVAMSHQRVASGYLRTGNIDLAALEIEAMREAWGKISLLRRPAEFKSEERYTSVVLETAAALIGTTLVLNMGRADVAAESLIKIRRSLSDLRRENKVTVLADCVLDANVSMDALFALDGKPDWESVSAGAESYRGTLQRCDGMAPERVRRDGEFRRLIDGALASLA